MSSDDRSLIGVERSNGPSLETWIWHVVYSTEEKRRNVHSVEARHRAGAKQQVANWYSDIEESITHWERCYVPRPSWDCPICGTHEAMSKRPNLLTPPDWECMVCRTWGWGNPMDWEYLSEPSDTLGNPMTGPRTPDGPVSEGPGEAVR